jgi:hypothetical protein
VELDNLQYCEETKPVEVPVRLASTGMTVQVRWSFAQAEHKGYCFQTLWYWSELRVLEVSSRTNPQSAD